MLSEDTYTITTFYFNWLLIRKGYPQEQGKVEAYNKIIIAEFLEVEELIDEKDGQRGRSHLSIHIAMKENTVE